jgi:hypothetical protein
VTSPLAIVVLSCDGYSDLWGPFFELFFRYWPQCPYPVYLTANRKTHQDARVTTVLSGDDTDWSSSVRRSVAQVPEERVLFFYDDGLLTGDVDDQEIARYLSWFVSNGANYLRMRRALLRPNRRVGPNIGVIDRGSMWRTSLFGSIWNKDLILCLLKDGESAWAFELEGVRRADAYDGFYGTYREVFSFIHGVERGKWFPWVPWYLARKGVSIDLKARQTLSLPDVARYVIGKPKGELLSRLPPSLYPELLKAKRSVVRLMRGA